MTGRRGSPLRRTDWRFVLPTTAPAVDELVLLGASDATATLVVEMGLARSVHRALPSDRQVDAIVVLAGYEITVEEIAAILRPGGALYWEVDRRPRAWFRSSPSSVRARLRAAGFVPVATYWARPAFDRIRVLIPIDRPHPLRWYIERIYGASTLPKMLLEGALRIATGLDGRRLAPFVRTYAVTAVRGPMAARARRPVLDDIDLPPALGDADQLPLVITGGEGDWSRVTLLPFARRGLEPTAVLKLPRIALFNSQTENEQRALVDLAGRLEPRMQSTLPSPLGSRSWCGLSVAAETYAPGRSLFATINRWGTSTGRRIEALELATNWITEFHRTTSRLTVFDAGRQRSLVTDPLARFRSIFGTTSKEERLFDEIERRAGQLIGTTLPLVPQHNDLGPWNIFVSQARPTVIDWEVARWGAPFVDLLYHVMHWSFTVRRADGEDERRLVIAELAGSHPRSDAIAGAARVAIRRYAGALGLDPRSAPMYLVLMAVEQAVDRVMRLEPLGQNPANPREGNRYVGYVEALGRALVP